MLDVHVVAHTHWDREWYLPFERFQQRLVALVDDLLDDPPRPGESFLLDGQAILLADYLAVKPERESELRALLRDGRLEAGPWFVLADELIPSGEALVRNLFAGRRTLRQLGADVIPVLYCPDSFGHPATLPAIAEGFQLPLIVLWRGYGSRRWPRGDAARWEAPGGERALLYHLPRSGYEFGANLPTDPDAARARWQHMRQELSGRSSTGTLLVLNGADHHARQLNRGDALSALERTATGDQVRRSSLTEFTKRLVGGAVNQRLPIVRGELRDSYGYTWTLQGTFGTRAAQKRLNARAERLLLRDAEPWAALAAAPGAFPGRSRRALTNSAWRSLLAAHPHDTLCGCSVDVVAEAMELRIQAAIVQAEGVREDAIADLVRHDIPVARDARERWHPVVLIRNCAARARTGVAVIDVMEFVADVAVGPGSGESALMESPRKRLGDLPGLEGIAATQLLSHRLEYNRVESPRHYPDNDLVRTSRVAVWVENVPGYGISAHATVPAATSPPPRVVSGSVAVSETSMRNGIVSVEVGPNGAVTLTHLDSGRTITNFLTFEDCTDVGDLYTPAPRDDYSAAHFLDVHRVHVGPLRGELELRWRLVRMGKAKKVAGTLVARLILDAQSPLLRVAVAGDNHGRDHRLRVRFRTDVDAPQVSADAAFGTVARSPIDLPDPERKTEAAPPTAPLHRYVTLLGKRCGATVFSDGLAEYEVTTDGTVLVTLLRAVGELSRCDLPERPGHAGWPTATPRAQSIGPFAGEFAVLLHGGRSSSTINAIEHAADDALLPLVGSTLRSALRVPATTRGVELEGDGLAFSTMKESEDGEWLVVRCVNLLKEAVRGRWRFGFPVREAQLARLDETSTKKLKVGEDAVSFDAAAHAIITILVR